MDARFVVSSACFLLFFCVATAIGQQQQHDNHHEQHRVNVAVYYESLCPDSIKFFTQQLYPSLQGNLSNYVNLTLLPYGKATDTFDVNQFEFTCQHGPRECHGNKLQACALRKIDDGRRTPGLGYNKVTLGFINCLMDKVKREGNDTQFPTTECATINHVTILSDIENCANHPEGSKYLADIGKITKALSPPITDVPVIVFNQQYKDEDNKLARNNFVKALCQYIHGEKPAECSVSSAPSLTRGTVAAVLVMATSLLAFL